MNDKKGISLARYIKRPKWELELRAENPLADNSKLDTRLRDELAHKRLSQPLHEAFIVEVWARAEGSSRAQSDRAKTPRQSTVLMKIIDRLAAREGTAKELWPELLGSLDRGDCDPKEIDQPGNSRSPWRIEYNDEQGRVKRIIYATFENKLSKARKK